MGGSVPGAGAAMSGGLGGILQGKLGQSPIMAALSSLNGQTAPTAAAVQPSVMAPPGTPAPTQAPGEMTALPGDRAQLPQQLYQHALQLGFNPQQSAAILGNMKQESEFNTKAWNPGEGAEGLIQWREGRRVDLQNFAKSQGKDYHDPFVQMDFLKHEMDTTEAGNSGAFKQAKDLDSANAGLKRYIRYGDDSQGTRRNNGAQYLKQFAGLDAGSPAAYGQMASTSGGLDRIFAAAQGQPVAGGATDIQMAQQKPQSTLDRVMAMTQQSPEQKQLKPRAGVQLGGGDQIQPSETVDLAEADLAQTNQDLAAKRAQPNQRSTARKLALTKQTRYTA